MEGESLSEERSDLPGGVADLVQVSIDSGEDRKGQEIQQGDDRTRLLQPWFNGEFAMEDERRRRDS